MMKLVSALPLLLLAIESSSAFTTRNLQGDIVELANATTTKVYEPPAAYNDTVIPYPDGFWQILNDSFIVYDTYGLMNDTLAPPGVIEYAPMAFESMVADNFTGYDLPVAYYYVNDSSPVPLYTIPKTFLRGNDNTTLVAVPGGVAPMMEPDVMFSDAGPILLSTAPMQDMPVTILDEPVFMDFGMVNETSNETLPIKYVGLPVLMSNETEPVMMPFVTASEVNQTEVYYTMTGVTPEAVYLNNTEVYYMMTGENNPEGPINVTMLPEVVYSTAGEPVNITSQPPEIAYSTTGVEPPPIVIQPPPPMTHPIQSSGEDHPGMEDDSGKPAWWGLVKDTSKDVKSCKKRKNVAPVTGDSCSKKKEKTCFFGNQECPLSTYPATVCKCTAGTWSCSPATCP